MKQASLCIDFDGTICDTNLLKAKWIKDHLDIDIKSWQCDYTTCVPIIGEDNYKRAAVVYSPEYTRKAQPIPGALEFLKKWPAHIPVYILTARSEEAFYLIEEWLSFHNASNCVTGFFSSKKEAKLKTAHTLHALALVDDDIRHLVNKEDFTGKRILFKYRKPKEQEASLPHRIIETHSWQSIASFKNRLFETASFFLF